MKRGTGETSRQMLSLPIGGLFVQCNNAHDRYNNLLKLHIGRPDVIVVNPHYITSQIWMGKTISRVVVDHAYRDCETNLYAREKFFDCLQLLKDRIARDTTRN